MERLNPEWKHHRVIHSKYPPLDCFESEDAMILGELESATSDRVAHWPRYVDAVDFRYGPGWGPVMASFCYPTEGRFNTLSRGAYYAGDSIETALREWVYHAGKVWLGFGVGNDCSAVVRCYTGHITEPIVDLRNQPLYMQDTNYAPGQKNRSGSPECGRIRGSIQLRTQPGRRSGSPAAATGDHSGNSGGALCGAVEWRAVYAVCEAGGVQPAVGFAKALQKSHRPSC